MNCISRVILLGLQLPGRTRVLCVEQGARCCLIKCKVSVMVCVCAQSPDACRTDVLFHWLISQPRQSNEKLIASFNLFQDEWLPKEFNFRLHSSRTKEEMSQYRPDVSVVYLQVFLFWRADYVLSVPQTLAFMTDADLGDVILCCCQSKDILFVSS